MTAEFTLRKIRKQDNPAVAGIIRTVMSEFGATGCGYSSEDAEVDAMFEAYSASNAVYYVIEQQGKVLGCGGMSPLEGGTADVCELRKMYFLTELRGSGLGARLLKQILAAAREAGFRLCYLETLENMTGARHLYLKHGFVFIKGQMGSTGHGGCNTYMTLEL